ncbi:MAG: hypothetical protein COA88_15415 [Kordia sp.]|nr:MAG: hypothetical protein COA88_15415 [Kordia sp.]
MKITSANGVATKKIVKQ